MHEETLVTKLGLRQKFSRYVLCTRRNTIGIGLIKSNTTITILVMKLYISNRRANNKINKMIEILDEMETIKNGKGVINILNTKFSKNIETSHKTIQRIMINRNIEINNNISKSI